MNDEQEYYGESVTIGSIKHQKQIVRIPDYYNMSFSKKVQVLREGRYDEILMTSQVRIAEAIKLSKRQEDNKRKLKTGRMFNKGSRTWKSKMKKRNQIVI